MLLRRFSYPGFTLIELLTVIAILGILAAIVISTVSGARNSANRAQTKAQFNQWAVAMELFRQEYGFYPDIAVGGKVEPTRFASELTGRTLAGTAVTGSTANRKGFNFYTISTSDLDAAGTHLSDAFGNTEIGVRIDTNRDGLINGSDTGSWVAVAGLDGTFSPTTTDDAVPTSGVRAKGVFYSAGLGHDANDLVLSWR